MLSLSPPAVPQVVQCNCFSEARSVCEVPSVISDMRRLYMGLIPFVSGRPVHWRMKTPSAPFLLKALPAHPA
jgi:hypothetical protein